jgi:hypothetical protein
MRGFGAFQAARALIVVLACGWLVGPSDAFSATQHPSPEKMPFTYNTSGIVDVGADPASVTGSA